MCMKISEKNFIDISKEDLLRINRGFGGTLRNSSSIDFAFHIFNNKKFGVYKKLAHLIRAIIVDHPFSDANKRTATFVVFAFAKKYNKQVNRDLLLHHFVSISKKNINTIKNIEYRLKNAIS